MRVACSHNRSTSVEETKDGRKVLLCSACATIVRELGAEDALIAAAVDEVAKRDPSAVGAAHGMASLSFARAGAR